jgi:hypothetical protein
VRKNYCEPGELSIPHGHTFFPERAFPIREKGCGIIVQTWLGCPFAAARNAQV